MFGADAGIDFGAVKSHFGALKAFYYDCAEVPKKDETSEQFESRTDAQRRLFNQIRSLPGFHVRLGTLSGKAGKTRQKEVDVLLAVDMLTHTFYKNMARATLLAGDLDFRPIVESLVRLGAYVRVAYEPASASQDLCTAADEGVPRNIDDLWEWSDLEFRRHHKIPISENGGIQPESRTF